MHLTVSDQKSPGVNHSPKWPFSENGKNFPAIYIVPDIVLLDKRRLSSILIKSILKDHHKPLAYFN